MAEKKKRNRKYHPGKELRAIVTKEQISRRNEIKVLIAHLTDRAYGRVSDNEVVGFAIDMYYERFVVKGETLVPEVYRPELQKDLIREYKEELRERKKIEAARKKE